MNEVCSEVYFSWPFNQTPIGDQSCDFEGGVTWSGMVCRAIAERPHRSELLLSVQ